MWRTSVTRNSAIASCKEEMPSVSSHLQNSLNFGWSDSHRCGRRGWGWSLKFECWSEEWAERKLQRRWIVTWQVGKDGRLDWSPRDQGRGPELPSGVGLEGLVADDIFKWMCTNNSEKTMGGILLAVGMMRETVSRQRVYSLTIKSDWIDKYEVGDLVNIRKEEERLERSCKD